MLIQSRLRQLHRLFPYRPLNQRLGDQLVLLPLKFLIHFFAGKMFGIISFANPTDKMIPLRMIGSEQHFHHMLMPPHASHIFLRTAAGTIQTQGCRVGCRCVDFDQRNRVLPIISKIIDVCKNGVFLLNMLLNGFSSCI